MTRRPRRNHRPAFKAKVALAAVKGEKTFADLAQQFDEVSECAMRESAGVSPRSIRRPASVARRRASYRRKKVSLTERPLRRTWTRQDPEESFVKVVRSGVEIWRKASRHGVLSCALELT